MPKTVAIIGGRGQLGSDLDQYLCHLGHRTHIIDREEIDLLETDAIQSNLQSLLQTESLDWVINCAAMTHTGECELNPKLSDRLNHLAAVEVAHFAREKSAGHILIGTDYVFDGKAEKPYLETDLASPINIYGTSKLAGEQGALAAYPETLVFRLASLMGVKGARGKKGNFIEFVIQKAKESGKVTVVEDQRMSPTHTLTFCELIEPIVDGRCSLAGGVYHASGSGGCSWLDLASYVFKKLEIKAEIIPCSLEDFPAQLERPLYTVLNTSKLQKSIPVKSWQEHMDDYLVSRKEYRS